MRVTSKSQVVSIGFVALLLAHSAAAITIRTVPVGNPGNASYGSYGAVAYNYNIGKFEVTVGQYTAFLNAVAATDTYVLYETYMASDLHIAGIARTGSPGSYIYSVIGSPNHPVTYVDWGDAARFANWLHNGQPTGAQNASTTEDGAYTLNGATSVEALMAILRNPGAKWFIPSANEWVKAGYHQPAAQGGPAYDYWNYPMRTNSVPYSDQPPGDTPDNTRVANFLYDDGLPNDYNDGYAVTGSPTLSSNQNYLTDVGVYSLSPSFYGTFDQGGNVREWTEEVKTLVAGQFRGVFGGSWMDDESILLFRGTVASYYPDVRVPTTGFRVANIPAYPLGDYNLNGVVDAADYVWWRNNNGSPADYNTWRTRFGTTAGSGASASPIDTVPEPACIVLVIYSLLSLKMRFCRLRSPRGGSPTVL